MNFYALSGLLDFATSAFVGVYVFTRTGPIPGTYLWRVLP